MNGLEPAARKQKILSAIVERYIRSGEPVGSKSLLADAGLKVSSATVRNDMAELTEKGYIAQPHTSAGRVPTELGYRYYVDNVMQLTPVSEHGRATIRDTLSAGADSPESILQCAAELLCGADHNARRRRGKGAAHQLCVHRRPRRHGGCDCVQRRDYHAAVPV